MEGTAKIGCFTVTGCCRECDWFQVPVGLWKVKGKPCCPECGGDIVEKVGRFRHRFVKYMFGLCEHVEYLGFLRKEEVKVDA